MPTIKQEKAFKTVVENGGNVSRAMLSVGYSPATANTPQKLTESKGWQELLAQVDDKVILDKVYDILLSSDKRASLSAADTLLKLKDRYPANKSKFIGVFENLKALRDER